MPSKEWFNFTAQGVTDREEFPMPPSGIVFLFDVDNTLLDNDRVTKDLQHYLEREGTGSFSTGGRDDHPHRGLAQA